MIEYTYKRTYFYNCSTCKAPRQTVSKLLLQKGICAKCRRVAVDPRQVSFL